MELKALTIVTFSIVGTFTPSSVPKEALDITRVASPKLRVRLRVFRPKNEAWFLESPLMKGDKNNRGSVVVKRMTKLEKGAVPPALAGTSELPSLAGILSVAAEALIVSPGIAAPPSAAVRNNFTGKHPRADTP